MGCRGQHSNDLAELKLDALLEASHDGIWIIERDGTILNVNSAAIRMNGLQGFEVIGKNIREFHEKGFFGSGRLASVEAVKAKKPCTVIQRFKNGTRALVTGTPVFDQKGHVAFVIVNDRDISELNQLAAQLEFSRTAMTRRGSHKSGTDSFYLPSVIAQSQVTRETIEKAIKLSKVGCTVLVCGETGVGKGLIAQLIHDHSEKKGSPFVSINCSAIPETLIESELFGYEYGAFTGSRKTGKKGLVELANGGTLFFDEIGDLSLSGQAKLLRLLETKEIIPLGGSKPHKIDFRIIAATNRNLSDMINKGIFRQDLFFRLSVVTIYVPPLRERREDIVPLSQFFLDKTNKKYQLEKKFSTEALSLLESLSYPGNVRELSNLVENLALTVEEDLIDVSAFPRSLLETSDLTRNATLKEAVTKFEAKLIESTIREHGNQQRAAKALDVNQATLSRKMKRHRILLDHIVHERSG